MAENPEYDPAQKFRDMAERIEANKAEEFGGAILIIPPESPDGRGGDPIELLIIDPAQDLANFWSTAKSRAAIAADEFIAQQSVPPLGGYR